MRISDSHHATSSSAAARATLGVISGAHIELTEEAVATIAKEVARILSTEGRSRTSGWLTAAQAAEHLGWPIQRVYKLTSAGAIPHRKHRQRLLFDRDELDAWLERYAHGPAARGFQFVSRAS